MVKQWHPHNTVKACLLQVYFKLQLILIKCASCEQSAVIDKTTHWQMAAGRTANQ